MKAEIATSLRSSHVGLVCHPQTLQTPVGFWGCYSKSAPKTCWTCVPKTCWTCVPPPNLNDSKKVVYHPQTCLGVLFKDSLTPLL